jgi:hypothetical protein
MAPDKQVRRKPKPRHSATHITVWNMNGSPVSPLLIQRIEAAVEKEIEDERMLIQVVRV